MANQSPLSFGLVTMSCGDCTQVSGIWECTMNCSSRGRAMRDVHAAATSIIHADDGTLQLLAKRDPDIFRDVAAALIAARDPSPHWKQPTPVCGAPSSASEPAATNASLATRLQAAREKCFLSLAGASSRIGCSKAHLWELEVARTTNPTIKILQAAAETYGVTVSWLIGERA
jgi:hypothetical protein